MGIARQSAWAMVLAASALALGGCTTIVSGRNQGVLIKTSPPGAAVMIDGVNRGLTPTAAVLPRRRPHEVEIRKECFQPVHAVLEKHLNFGLWFFGNLLSWAPLGWFIDLATATPYYLRPNPLHATLAPDESPTPECAEMLDRSPYTVAGALHTLSSVDNADFRQAAKTLYAANGLTTSQLDRVAYQIVTDQGSEDDLRVDGLAFLAMTIEKSEQGRYKPMLRGVAETARTRKLRWAADDAADDLPDPTADVFDASSYWAPAPVQPAGDPPSAYSRTAVARPTAAGAPAGAKPAERRDPMSRLQELEEMYRAGLITREVYEAKQGEILDDL